MPCVNAGEHSAKVRKWSFQPWPDVAEGDVVEFRLIYRGKLPAQGAGSGQSRIDEKHAIRRQLHRQLRELWHTHTTLRRHTAPTTHTRKLIVPDLRDDESQQATMLDWILRDYSKFNYRFVPLVNNKNGIACALDILFLRRDAPGNLIESGGDIDNRIKVLFDGLRVPQYNSEVDKFTPQEGENPFFVLLEDDKLITEVKVTTDRLLTPPETDESVHDVHLVIHVATKIVDPHKAWPDWVF
jgi:hypothetical protein